MIFFYLIVIFFIFLLISYFLDFLVTLISPRFQRSYFYKIVRTIFFSTVLGGLCNSILSPYSLFLQILLTALLSVWAYLFAASKAHSAVKLAEAQRNATGELNHSREALISLCYIILIPLFCFFSAASFLYTSAPFPYIWVSVTAILRFVNQWPPSFIIISVVGIVLFAAVTPIVNIVFAFILGPIIRLAKLLFSPGSVPSARREYIESQAYGNAGGPEPREQEQAAPPEQTPDAFIPADWLTACPSCGYETDKRKIFCEWCGAPLQRDS